MSGFRAPPAAPPRAPPPAFDDSSDDDSSEDTDTFTSGKPSTGKSAMPAFTPSRVSIGDGGQGMDQMDQMLNDKKIALAEQKRLQVSSVPYRFYPTSQPPLLTPTHPRVICRWRNSRPGRPRA